MQDEVHISASKPACLEVAYVCVDQFMAAPRLRADRVAHVLEIEPMPSGEIIHGEDVLAQPEQRLDQMRSDEPGAAGDEPAIALAAQALFHLTKASHGQTP